MHIYYDDIKVLKQLIPSIDDHYNPQMKNEGSGAVSESICRAFFHEREYEFSIKPEEKFWQTLISVEHSDGSQFELLHSLLRASGKLPDRMICTAGSGQGFRGFKARAWMAEPGNLHLSLLIQPDRVLDRPAGGVLLFSIVAVLRVLKYDLSLGSRIAVRWINDILIDGDKVGGIITRTQMQAAAVRALLTGIGINVHQVPVVPVDRFVTGVTALCDHHQADLAEVFALILERIRESYEAYRDGGIGLLLEEYRTACDIVGNEVRLYSDPDSGPPVCIAAGKVERIGDDLELYISGYDRPFRKGRITFRS